MNEPLPSLTEAELDALAGEAPAQLDAGQRVARRRAIERRAIAGSGGGLALAGIARCPHGRLPALCRECAL